MSSLSACLRGAAAVLILGGILVYGVAPPAPAASDTSARAKPEPTAEKLRKALDQTVNLDIANESLDDVVTKLRQQTKINFVADPSAAQRFVGPPNGPQGGISLKVEKGKLRHAFQAMLSTHGLGYAVLGDQVLIAFRDEAIRRQVEQPVSMRFEETRLADALKHLANATGTRLVLDVRAKKEAASPVTLDLDDVALDDGLQLLANMAGLKTVLVGNIVYVTTKANARELQAEQNAKAQRRGGNNPYGNPFTAGTSYLAPVAPPPVAAPAPRADK
ncbi:MAG TPA: hypothetical protein VG013_01910 [Gemmataceae bacterium]|jgi:type II secretory pathway component GspD/PulD (secretin)|nr:hypothetical protein [Gemmataceae bacterium]